jgi:hypothetical protein
MPKRKAPPEKHTWARMLGREWQVILVSGEVLKPARDLSATEARELASIHLVFLLSYGSPVRDLTGDARAIAKEIDLIADEPLLFTNSASLFRGSMGSAAVVLEYIH